MNGTVEVVPGVRVSPYTLYVDSWKALSKDWLEGYGMCSGPT